jgi:hypothetical protein
MVSEKIGGRKKKLRQSIAAIDVIVDSSKPQWAATTSTTSKYEKPATRALTCSRKNAT